MAKPLNADGAAPPLTLLSIDHWLPQKLTVPVVLLSPMTNAPPPAPGAFGVDEASPWCQTTAGSTRRRRRSPALCPGRVAGRRHVALGGAAGVGRRRCSDCVPELEGQGAAGDRRHAVLLEHARERDGRAVEDRAGGPVYVGGVCSFVTMKVTVVELAGVLRVRREGSRSSVYVPAASFGRDGARGDAGRVGRAAAGLGAVQGECDRACRRSACRWWCRSAWPTPWRHRGSRSWSRRCR